MMKTEELSSELPPNGTSRESMRRFWIPGVALLALVVVILGGAFALGKQLRPPVGIETAVGGVGHSTPTDAGAASDTATFGDGLSPSVVSSSPSVSPSLESDVEAAYLRYWDDYGSALLNLDTSAMTTTAVGEELARINDEVATFQRRDRALRVDVTHDYVIFNVTPSEATLEDHMVNRSFTVDPVTKNPPTGPGQSAVLKDVFYFLKVDGVWKVSRSIRLEG